MSIADAKLSTCADEDVLAALEVLDTRPKIVPAPEWPGELQGIREAGLYSWWVDEAGASDIAEGLGVPIALGRIYAGQAGALFCTLGWMSGDVGRWPSQLKARSLGIRCARCGAEDPRPLVFGLPDWALSDASRRGDIALGGCLVPPDPRPAWQCRNCGHEFPDPPVHGSLAAGGDT